MRQEQAINGLTYIYEYIERDEIFIDRVKTLLMDACVMAIEALKKNEELNQQLDRAYEIIGQMIDR